MENDVSGTLWVPPLLERPSRTGQKGLENMDSRLSKACLDLSMFVLKHPDTRSRLIAIRNYAVRQLHAPMFYIGLYDPSRETLEFSMAYDNGKPRPRKALNLREQKKPSLVGYVMKTHQPIFWMNREQKEEAISRLNLKPLRSGRACQTCWICPLEAEGEVLGVISVQSPVSNAWQESEVQHFKDLVHLASIAIVNARIVERHKKLTELFKNIQKASSELISSPDPSMVLQNIVRHAVVTMGAWRSNIIIIAEEGEPTAEVAVGFRSKPEQLLARPNGVSRGVIRTAQPAFFEDVTRHKSRVNRGMLEDGVRSAVCLPFIYEGKVIGVMWGHYKERATFTPEVKDAWTVFANQAAVAYGNARKVIEMSRVRQLQDSLIDSSFDAIVAIDEDQRIIEFNKQAEDLLGYTFSEVKGRPVAMLHSSLADARRISRRLQRDHQLTNYPVTVIDRQNRPIRVLLSARSIPDTSCSRGGIQVGYIRDLREVHLLEERLRALIDAGHVVNQASSMPAVYRHVIAAVRKSFPQAMNCVVHLYDEEKGKLFRLSERGVLDVINEREAFLPGEGIAGWVFKHRESQVLDDASKDRRYKFIKLPRQGSQKSMICALLEAGRQPIGTITVHNNRKAGLFNEEDLRLLSGFAAQVGMALDNARKHDALRREERERKLVASIGERLPKQQNVQSILKLLADAGRDLLGVEIAVAHLIDDVTAEIHSYSEPEGYDITPPRRSKSHRKGLTDIILETGRVLAIGDVSADQRVNPEVREKGVKSLIGFPLHLPGNGPRGVIFFDSRRQIGFSRNNINLISLLITQSSHALANALQQQRRESRLDRLELLSKFSKEIIQQLPAGQERSQYGIILKYLADILNAEGTSLLLVDQAGRLEKKACHGHLTLDHEVGRKFEIHNQPKGGLTGWIAHHKKLFNEHGDRLRNHPAAAGRSNVHLRSGACTALLCIPLLVKSEGKTAYLGLLEAENKRNAHGQVDDSLGFSKEDEWIADIFAKTVLTILEASGGYRKTKERLEKHAASLDFLYGAGKKIVAGEGDLSEVLQNIARRAWWLTGRTGERATFADIFLVDDDRARFAAAHPPAEAARIAKRLGNGISLKGNGHIGIVGKAIRDQNYHLVSNVEDDPDYLETHAKTRAELAIPIVFGTEVLGAINVEHTAAGAFNEEDVQDLELLAIQAAIAIRNARDMLDLERDKQYWKMLSETSRVISRGGISNKKELLRAILTQAAEVVHLPKGARVTLAAFQMLLPDGKHICLEGVIPEKAAEKVQVGQIRSLNRADGRIGISGLAILRKRTIIVDDVSRNSNYIEISPTSRSEIDVPLIDNGKVFGTISLESSLPASFDERDQKALEALAELAVVALKNVDAYLELKEAKTRFASLMAVAWVNWAGGVWSHKIQGKATSIHNLAGLAQPRLQNLQLTPADIRFVQGKLAFIDRLAREIFEEDVALPSGTGTELVPVSVNELIEGRLQQAKKKPKFASIEVVSVLQQTGRVSVLVNPEAVGHAFEILIDNAEKAMRGQPVRRLTVLTAIQADRVEIRFIDTGKGVSKDIQPLIFKEPRPTKRSSGMGMGLLLAQLIVESNQGQIELSMSEPGCTVFTIRFPIYAERSSRHEAFRGSAHRSKEPMG